jgi:hypothetical protein
LKRSDYQDEIRELNLAHLMLAQKMLREDRETAMFRLGIGDAVADLLIGWSAWRVPRWFCRRFASMMRCLRACSRGRGATWRVRASMPPSLLPANRRTSRRKEPE